MGDTWEWKGDLLNIAGGDKLVATFELDEIVQHEGESMARITGVIEKGWPMRDGEEAAPEPTVKVELLFLLEQGLPLSGSFDYASRTRTTSIRTSARWASE